MARVPHRARLHTRVPQGSPNGNANFLSRLPEPATEHNRKGSTSLTPIEDGGIYLIRACGLHTPSSPFWVSAWVG